MKALAIHVYATQRQRNVETCQILLMIFELLGFLPFFTLGLLAIWGLFNYTVYTVCVLLCSYTLLRWIKKTSSIGMLNALEGVYQAKSVISRIVSDVRSLGGHLSSVSIEELDLAVAQFDSLIEKARAAPSGNSGMVARYTDVECIEVYSRVLNSESVRAVMSKSGASRRDVLKILRGLSRSQSPWILWGLGVLLRAALRVLFPLGIQISEADIARIKGALNQNGPMVLLPCHKSHMDYMILHLLAVDHGFPVPLVIAGDNLNVPLIGYLFQRSGAVMIRRSFAGDELYAAVFKEHTTALLRQGHAMECFIEGGRSRSGKLLPPKVGFVKAVVDAVLDGHIADVQVVPISIGYDRVLEMPSYVAELAGGAKQKEALLGAIHSAVTLLHLAYRRMVFYGRVDVAVAEPISVRKHFEMRKESLLESPSDLTAVRSRSQQALSLGYRVLHEVNGVAAILPTMLVGTVLLLHRRRGLRQNVLVEEVHWLQNEVRRRGGRVRDTTKSVEESVSVVVDRIMMGSSRNRLIKRHKDILMTGLFTPIERIELASFRNALIHLFVIESLLAVAYYSRARKTESMSGAVTPLTPSSALPSVGVSAEDMLEDCSFLSGVFKQEFIFKPTTLSAQSALQNNFYQALDSLKERGVFHSKAKNAWEAAMQSASDQADKLMLGSESEGTRLYSFLTAILHPFVDAYFVLAVTTYALLSNEATTASSSAIVSLAQKVGEKLFFDEQLNSFEAIAKDSLQNAVAVFAELGHLKGVQAVGASEKQFKLNDAISFKEQVLEKLNAFRDIKGDTMSAISLAVKESGLPKE